MRCDAGKPCGPCVKAALARNETASTIQCDYDGSAPDKQPASYSIPNTTKKPKSSSTSDRNKATLSKVGELEDKVAQLEAFIKNNGSRPVAQPDIFRSVYLENLSQKDDSPFRKATTASGTADASPSLSAEFQRTAFNKGSSGSSSSSSAHDATHSPPGDGTSQDFTNSNQFTHLFAAAPEPTPSSETSHAVHRVGWSSDLPPPHLTRKLIGPLPSLCTRFACSNHVFLLSRRHFLHKTSQFKLPYQQSPLYARFR